jgi:hypothetical protein
MFKLAEGSRIQDLKEKISDVTQRTLENDIAFLRRQGILRSEPEKKSVGKWGRPPKETNRKPGRPPIKYWLVNPHDLITSDLLSNEERKELIFFERSVIVLPEFKRRLEREAEAGIRFLKMTPQLVDAVRPFRKIPEFKNLLRNLPRSDEIQVDYSRLDATIPGEFVDRALMITRTSIPGEHFIPFEAEFKLRLASDL